MRAHWLSELEISNSYILSGDSLHHLVNVVRIEKGEKLLLLNGQGLFVETEVESISKKELRLKTLGHYHKERAYEFDLALGMPKRDALELSLKEATELGFRNIYLIKSEYSQMRFPEEDRTQKLLVSALEQSNASHLPKVIHIAWPDLPWNEYEEALLMDSQTKDPSLPKSSGTSSRLLIVGPEGGFSPSELEYFYEKQNLRCVHLQTPILRTPTAVAAGAGLMIQNLRND
jgi:16S rRNA (uracil1498-N3)-methyltransferase